MECFVGVELPLFGGPGGGANRGRFKFTGFSFGGISPVGGRTSLAPAENKFVRNVKFCQIKFLWPYQTN